MARILFTVPPLTGHLNPALAVAEALQAQGHVVAWAVHADKVGDKLPAGATVYDLNDGLEDDTTAAQQVRGLESVRLFYENYAVPLADRAVPYLEAAVRDFAPDVLAVDHQMLVGALVARKQGLPWASLITTSASILRMSGVFDDWVTEQYRGLQARHLSPEQVVERPEFSPHCAIVFSVEALLGSTHERIPAPYHFVGPAHGRGRRQVAFDWSWLREDSRKIFISLGTVSRDRDTRFFEVMMAALAEMPQVQAVMVAPPQLAEIAPPNVMICDYVPQTELLERVDGVICHAGHNTVCETLARGLPMIVAPIRDDQPVIARQVIDAGAALFMRHGKVTPNTARGLIERLLSEPELAENARRLSLELKNAVGAEGAAQLVAALAESSALEQVA